MSIFIGKGEERVKEILKRLFRTHLVCHQIPISRMIKQEDYDFLDERYQKHKFDLGALNIEKNSSEFIVEVNYKHGITATKKENNIFEPSLNRNNVKLVRVNDWDCCSIFKGKDDRNLTWDDFLDVINALKNAGVSP